MMLEVAPLPYFRVAMAVRKATWHDAFIPLSLTEFHAMYPDRQQGQF